MTGFTFRKSIIAIIVVLFGMFFGAVPAQAAEDCTTANCSGTTGIGSDDYVIGQPIEDVADAFVTPKVTISWPEVRDQYDVYATVDNRHGNKTYRAEIRTVLFAGNDVYSSPSEATDALVGIDRKVKVKAGKVKTFKLFTYRGDTWLSGTITRAKGAKMTDSTLHQRIKRFGGVGLDSVIRMEAWPTANDGTDITQVMCPSWLGTPSVWGISCQM